MQIFFALIQAMSFFLFVAYIYCKSPAFTPLRSGALKARHRLLLYAMFSALSITGTYLGLPVQGAIANTRAIGPILAGLIGGPGLGAAVGLTGGIHRWWLGGFTGLSCGLSTFTEGIIGGLVHLLLVRRGRADEVFQPVVALATAALAEAAQMAIILAVARPFPDALELVKVIAAPMIAANSVGAALFISIIRDRQELYDRVGADSSARALRIAERTLAVMSKGFDATVAPELARIIHQETRVGAVAVTDAARVLAFVGVGAEHHQAGTAIASDWTRRAIAESTTTYVDGVNERYQCPLSRDCPLHSVLVVPLLADGEVVGTIKLYEPAHRRFLDFNRTLGEGLKVLLSSQLLRARYQEQKSLLVMSELKLARAQVNPHFLFNALNTIMALLPDSSRARGLLNHLANFFRANLKRSHELSTIEEELEHVSAYLEIEKARFEDRLAVELDVDRSLLQLRVPTFTLQPLMENAIKHGISDMLTPGTARIRVYRQDGAARVDVEDDAGAFDERKRRGDGLGLRIVDKRIRNLLGERHGLTTSCVPNQLTRVSFTVPLPVAAP
jgi:two-component system LytT family sensor kinase